MKKFPPHAACCFGAILLCLVLAFDLLLTRAVVIESDWQQQRFCRFNPAPGDCQ